jgi:ABC-2 type transport system ATP-binding protein
LIGDYDLAEQPVEAKAQLGYIPDHPFLYEKLTGREFVRFVARIYDHRSSIEEKIQKSFDFFEMTDKIDELIQGYSRGMRQKTAIIAALIHKPRIIFADEPTANLDPRSARLIKDIFRQLSRQGVTILMSTHVMEIAERLCDRIGIIYKGEFVTLGTLDEIRNQPATADSTLEDIFLELTDAVGINAEGTAKEFGS